MAVDIQTRKLRYYVAVAEELHFSRAAAKLFLAQQSLSKQISELESEIGTLLLRRTSRSVELTPAGVVFLAAAREVLGALDRGVIASRQAGHGQQGVLKLGFIVGAALELTSPILIEFNRRHPGIRLDLTEFPFEDTSAGLRDHSSDVAFVRLPVSVVELATEELFVEPRVLAVNRAHPLAGRTRLNVADLLDEPLTVGHTKDMAWREFWTLADHRTAPAPPRLIDTRSITEETELVSAGIASSVTVAGAARYSPHAGVSYVPIVDIPGVPVVVAWRPGSTNPLVEAFVKVACDVKAWETGIIEAIEHPERSPRMP